MAQSGMTMDPNAGRAGFDPVFDENTSFQLDFLTEPTGLLDLGIDLKKVKVCSLAGSRHVPLVVKCCIGSCILTFWARAEWAPRMQVAHKVTKQDTAFIAAYPHFNVNGELTATYCASLRASYVFVVAQLRSCSTFCCHACRLSCPTRSNRFNTPENWPEML